MKANKTKQNIISNMLLMAKQNPNIKIIIEDRNNKIIIEHGKIKQTSN